MCPDATAASHHQTAKPTGPTSGRHHTTIAVVAHHRRQQQAAALSTRINADHISWDDGTLGATGNHLAVWDWHAHNTTHGWAITIEDDGLPCDNFRDQLAAALAVAPAPVVSLYLGTGHPRQFQPLIERTLAATPDAHWLTHDHLLHAVAVAIHTDLLPLTLDPDLPIDEAITHWARRNHHHIAYTRPSLVDHADTDTLITNRADRTTNKPRHAWQHGTRTHWHKPTAPIT